jgi:uncharacterized delta-60 repeat protein
LVKLIKKGVWMKRFLLIASLLFSATNLFSTPPTAGTLDTSFSDVGYAVAVIGANTQMYSSAIQPDGKIVAAGSSDGAAIIARYDIQGDLDSTFGSSGYVAFNPFSSTCTAYNIAVQTDGKIVVTGSVQVPEEGFALFVARFLPNGLLDTIAHGGSGFGQGMETPRGYAVQQIVAVSNVTSYGIAIQPADQKIVMTGTADSNAFVARYTTAGLLDTSTDDGNIPFVAGVGYVVTSTAFYTAVAKSVALDSQGRIVITGQGSYDGSYYIYASRYLPDGTLDTNFAYGNQGWLMFDPSTSGSGAPYIGYDLGFQSLGSNADKIVIAGTDGTNAIAVRLTADGQVDSSFTNCVTTFGGSLGDASGLVIQQDDKIVIAGTSTRLGLQRISIARFVPNGGSLDDTFGVMGGYTNTTVLAEGESGNYNCFGKSLTIQSNGRFVVAGYSDSDTGNVLAIARYLGTVDVQGCMNVDYQADSTPGFCVNPTDIATIHLPGVIAVEPLSDNSFFVLTASDNFVSQLIQLDADGNVLTPKISIPKVSPQDVIVDAQGRAVVIGMDWIARYIITGGENTQFILDRSFNNGEIETLGTSLYRIGQITTGQLVGMSDDVGRKFGDSGQYQGDLSISIDGVTITRLFDMIIDSQNNVYFIGMSGSYHLYVSKFYYNPIDHNYYNTVNTDTGLTFGGSTVLTFDVDENIILMNVDGSGTLIVQNYRASDLTATSIYANLDAGQTLLSNPVVTKLQCDTNNRLVFTGYDDYDFFVGRLILVGDTYRLDTIVNGGDGFAPYSVAPGILKTMYNDNNPTDAITLRRVSNSIGISPNGSMVFGGFERIDSEQQLSLVGQVVGTTDVGQMPRYPGQVEKGTIDARFGTRGGLQIPGGLISSPQSMMVSNSGDFIIGVESAQQLVGLTNLYALNTTFGLSSSGVSPTLPYDFTNIKDIIKDNFGNIYVVGDNGSNLGLLTKLSRDGSQIIWTANLQMSSVTSVVQQASGRILVAGIKDGYGVIVAINPNTSDIDESFNQASLNPGFYFAGQYAPITALSIIDDSDRVLFSQAHESNVHISRLLENGSLDTSFPTGSATLLPSAIDWSAIRMAQDNNGKIAVVTLVGNDSGTTGFLASRYHEDGSDDVINVSIPVADNLAYSAKLKELVCLSDGTYLILGLNTNGSQLVLAHLKDDFTIDTDFGTDGILQTAVTSPVTMTDFYAVAIGSVSPYNILISATNGSNPYLIGVVSGFSEAVTVFNQSTPSWGPAGTLDTTYNNSGTVAGFLDLTNEISTNLGSPSVSKSMVQMSNGRYFVLSDTGYQAYESQATNSYVTKFNADDTQYTRFGIDGVLTIAGMKEAHDIIVDQNGNLIVVGMVDYPNGFIASFSSVDGWQSWNIVTSDFFYNYAIVQQTNGRILVAGTTANGPAIQAFNPNTGGRDITFGSNGIYTLYGGYGFAIHDLVLDSNDDIYFMADKDNQAWTFKLSQSGTKQIWKSATSVTSSNSLFEQIALQQNGNVIVTSVKNDFATLVFDSYDPATGVSTLGSPLELNLYALSLYRPRCNALVIDQTSPEGNIVVCGGDYEDAIVSNTAFIARILPDLSGWDTTFNSTGTLPGVQTVQAGSPAGVEWNDILIGANGKITGCGYEIFSDTKKAYLMRLYGNDFITQYSPAASTAGTSGTIDTSFATSGYLNLSAMSGPAATQLPQVVVPTTNGYQYVAFNQGALVQFNNGTSLSNFGDSGYGNNAPAGVYSMIVDSTGHPLLAGTNGSYGWVVRYTNNLTGSYDPNFNGGLAINLGAGTIATQVLEQTMGRVLVAGRDANGDATIWAFTDKGVADTTFNSNQTPGYYSTGAFHIIYAVVADQYDRLIYAHYANVGEGTQVDLTRLTASGEIDTTFGVDGTVSGIISNVNDASQIKIALDSNNNTVVAAYTETGIVVIAINQDGVVVENYITIPLTLSLPTSYPVLQGVIATSDGKVLVYGNQVSDDSDSMDMWIAKVQDDGDGNYELDTTFAPESFVPGIMQFHDITSTDILSRSCNCIAIYPTGEISIIGYENNDGTNVSFMSRAYNNPYNVTQELMCQFAKPIGTNDMTFGCDNNNGLLFRATQSHDTYREQTQAVALQDDQTIVAAINYQENYESTPSIVINIFDVDGLLQTDFNSGSPTYPYGSGQALVLDSFDSQYVQDMLTFTTIDGVHKALLAGYVGNNTLGTENSLLLQYILDPIDPTLDTSFGGLSGDLPGVAIGVDYCKAYTLNRQSLGRIILGGINPVQDNTGVFQAYTSNGALDLSFGQKGYFSQGNAGIYTSVVDSQDRIVFAYNINDNSIMVSRLLPDGSGLDTSFGLEGNYPISVYPYAQGVNSNLRLAIDTSGNIFLITVGISEGSIGIVLTKIDADGDYNHHESWQFHNAYFGGLSNFTITQLLVTDNAPYIVMVGYDQVSEGQDQIVVASFVPYSGVYILNPYFNANNSSGYLKYGVQDYRYQQSAGGLIHPDGRIIIAGAASGALG